MDVWDLTAMPPGSSGDKDNFTTSDKVTDAAIKLLSNPDHSGKRFYMWAHYLDPHAEYVPHQETPDLGWGGLKWGLRGLYDGEVWFTDKHVGRLIDFIESQPWGKDTAIVVTSDHGEAFVEHNMSNHGAEVWDVLVRVPLLIYVPGNEPHRVRVSRGHIDVVPTILDLMRVPQPPPGELSGESLLPDLVKTDGFEVRDVLVDMPAGPNNLLRRALIHENWKLLHYGGRYYQLFNLATDPAESQDLAGRDRAKLNEMIELYEQKRATMKEVFVEPDKPSPQ
jgi:arylsulfatase A-like enzyme